MWIAVAAGCAGLFAGAAVYITAVEHPARMACGAELAVREFGPSYRRAAVLQASLAVVGCLTGIAAAWRDADWWVFSASLLLGAVVPFTLVVIFPTNAQLLDPELDAQSARALVLLERWGRLHAVRSVLGALAFLTLLWRLAERPAAG